MASAMVVIVVSIAMMVGGGRLMRFEKDSKTEGMLSCLIGTSLSLAWYRAFPNDFADLADFIGRTFHRMPWAEGAVPALVVAALLPASIAALCIYFVVRWEQRQTRGVNTFFGPVGRVRRPKLLR